MSDSESSSSETDFKRDNRKRPREVSTKAPIARTLLIVPKKKVRYDPRFECGDFDRIQFTRDYDFINDMRKNELKELKKAGRKEKNPDKADRIRETARNLENQLRSTDEVNAEIEAKAELRRENIRRMNEGANPVYLNRKQMKSKIMEKRFEKIKSGGNMKRYLKKRKVKALKKGLDVE